MTFPATKGCLRLKQVLEVLPIGRSTWYAGIQSGRFPKPIKIGERMSVWRAEDIYQLIEQSNEGGK